MTAIQQAVVDDSGNINVHGRSGLVLVVKIETETEGEYTDISESDLFFEVSAKYRVALSAGDDDYSRKVILTREQVALLPLNQAVPFALNDETPTTPATLWSGRMTAYGFRSAPTGADAVEGTATNWTGATVIVRQADTTPTIIIRYDGPPGSRVVSFPLWAAGRPDAAELLLRAELDTDVTLVEARSRASALTGATSEATFLVALDGTQVGTAIFGAGSAEGVVDLTTTAATAGSVLTITAPVSQDTTLAGVSITLSANR